MLTIIAHSTIPPPSATIEPKEALNIFYGTNYATWFCGHWHTDKRIDRMHFQSHSFVSEEQIELSDDEKD